MEQREVRTATPPLKWPGGKRSLLPTILENMPRSFGSYHEPFLGGGALYFKLYSEGLLKKASWSRLNDVNSVLTTTYIEIREDVERVITRLKVHARRNSSDYFYKLRAKRQPDGHGAIAARLIYFNRTCFNGLYRVNLSGEFNVPYGNYKNPKILDGDNLRACSVALKRTRITSFDFEDCAKHVVKDDFVYFDPPYMPRLGKEFVGYDNSKFGLSEHIRLRDCALRLKKLGAHVMISNSGADEVRELYKKGFKLLEVKGRRTIGASSTTRGYMPDLLIW